MEFKDRIILLRKEKGLTQAQIAVHLNKGESAIRMWETGRSKPDADTLIKLSKYFNCTTDYLLGIAEFKDRQDFEKTECLLNELSAILQNTPAGKEFIETLRDCLCQIETDTPDYSERITRLAHIIFHYGRIYRKINSPDGEELSVLFLQLVNLHESHSYISAKIDMIQKELLTTAFNDINNLLKVRKPV